MFEKHEAEAYINITAPSELKNRIWRSIENRRRSIMKQNVVWISAAACIMLMFLSVGFPGNSGVSVLVNGFELSEQAVILSDVSNTVMAASSMVRSAEPQIQIPLEIHVEKEAYIRVSQGVLQEADGTMLNDQESEMVFETDQKKVKLKEAQLVYWIITGNVPKEAECTITVGKKEYTYVVEFQKEKNFFSIKRKK